MPIAPFEFLLSEKILFLGEGNFSFSHCLLKQLEEKLGISNFSNVYITCFQSELSPSALKNVHYLLHLGAEVLLNIDATKLEVEPRFSCLKFDKIIFNFPHVGGKMKIHLNRELLQKFFISASKVLNFPGEVIVTLCSGQGGTGFDLVPRRWDDTWQIVEQAAYGNFILFQTELFPHELFPCYKSNGYRGRDQMFSTKSGVIHSFCTSVPIITHLSAYCLKNIKKFHYVSSDLLVSYIHKFCINLNPFNNDYSPQKYLKIVLKNLFKNHCPNAVILSNDLPYTIDLNSVDAPCVFKGQKCCLRSSLAEVIPNFKEVCFLSYGLVFRQCSSDFTDLCTRCQITVKCPIDITRSLISNITSQFRFSGDISEERDERGQWRLYFEDKTLLRNKVAWEETKMNYVTFDLDYICSYIFGVSIKQLWCPKLKLDVSNNILILPSLYPLEFTFDISFAPKKKLNFDKFYYLLHQLPDNLIESVKLVSTYYLSESETSYCFRLVYKSYTKPLNKHLAIEFHQNVLGKMLLDILAVRIR